MFSIYPFHLYTLSDPELSMPAMRSHHSLSRREIFQNLANRIIYSKFYMILYLVMAILSVWSIFLSFQQGCSSSSLFIVLESIINGTMIAEVAVRLTALGRVRKEELGCANRMKKSSASMLYHP